MDITRLTALTGADPHEVEDLVVRIEQRAPEDRAELLRELAPALGLGEVHEARTLDADRQPPAAPRTDVADAAAVDLGFD